MNNETRKDSQGDSDEVPSSAVKQNASEARRRVSKLTPAERRALEISIFGKILGPSK